jgi:hypothetical protein
MAIYSIEARTWRDKTYGNTYYSLRIMGKGLDLVVPMEYGHGEGQYRWRAAKELGVDYSVMTWDLRREMFDVSEYQVRRQKDLHQLAKEGKR